MNCDRLKNELKNKPYALFIESEDNRKYFTEFSSSDGFLIVTDKKAVFLTDGRYIEAAQRECVDCDEILIFEGIEKSLVPVIENLGINAVAVETEKMALSSWERLKKILPCTILTDNEGERIVNNLRSVKNETEINKIMKAQGIAEKAFEHILTFIVEGMTEREIQLELDYFMLKNGADALSFDTICVSGENTSKPHGVPGNRKIQNGDFITLDFGAVVDGYHSDMTRTVAFGYATDEMKRVYDTVLSAQTEALKLIKKDVKCSDVDKCARDVIAKNGYGEYFTHSLGHGVGVEIHEEPVLSPKSLHVLAAGNVVTDEPGIYIPGKFGVRTEDMVYVTENGCVNLTKAVKSLIVISPTREKGQ